jgi:streptogramin lyase
MTAVPAPGPGLNPVAAQPSPPITLSGQGFGFLPEGEPYTGNSNYLEIMDWTQNWTAGYTGSLCNVTIGNWADNRIELVANLNQNGLCPLAAGDQMSISVWNPQTGSSAVTSSLAVASDPTYSLGSNLVFVGSAAGSGTAQLIASGPWTASSNASWLQLSEASNSGVGSLLVQFSYDANTSSAAQTGTLTIAGITFTVTQAPAGYVPAVSTTTLVASGLNSPQGVAVDAQGNVYIADTGNHAIERWNAITSQTITLAPGLNAPTGVAVDANGNVYIADGGSQSILEWNASTQQVTTLVAGLGDPYGVALDAQANVYFSDSTNNAIGEWTPSNQQVVTLGGTGANDPLGLAVDGFGNVYFANAGEDAIGQLSPGVQQVSALVQSLTAGPSGVAVDGQDNVYFSVPGTNAIQQWNAATGQVTTLSTPGLNYPAGIAVDGQGILYVAEPNNNAVMKFIFAYVSLSSTKRDRTRGGRGGLLHGAGISGEHAHRSHQQRLLANDYQRHGRDSRFRIPGEHFERQPCGANHGAQPAGYRDAERNRIEHTDDHIPAAPKPAIRLSAVYGQRDRIVGSLRDLHFNYHAGLHRIGRHCDAGCRGNLHDPGHTIRRRQLLSRPARQPELPGYASEPDDYVPIAVESGVWHSAVCGQRDRELGFGRGLRLQHPDGLRGIGRQCGARRHRNLHHPGDAGRQ